jgi:hypothetical protein
MIRAHYSFEQAGPQEQRAEHRIDEKDHDPCNHPAPVRERFRLLLPGAPEGASRARARSA